MSIPAVNPDNLPAIPTLVRQWVYFVYLLALLAANAVDAFYHDPDPDPWWLPGALRVLNVVGLFIMAVVLAHTRPTVSERRNTAVKEERKAAVEAAADQLGPGQLGHPEHLQPRPVTEAGRPGRDDEIEPH